MSLKKHFVWLALVCCAAEFCVRRHDPAQGQCRRHRQNPRRETRRRRRGRWLYRAGRAAQLHHEDFQGRPKPLAGNRRVQPARQRQRAAILLPPTPRPSPARDVRIWSSKSARRWCRCARRRDSAPAFSSTRTAISSPISTSSRARRKFPWKSITRHDGQLDRETYKQVKIIAINKFHDLALLHIEDKNAPKFKSVTLGSADALNVGDRRVCHRQPARPRTHGHAGHLQHQDARSWRASFICRPARRSIPATAAARCSTSPAKSWA